MKQKELTELTDQDLLVKAKKMKSNARISAALIGFMIGVVIWSVVKNTVGLFTLIPLFFVYKMINTPSDDKALKELLEERNLKY